VELLPDSSLAAEVEAKEKDRLAKAKAQMSPEEIENVIKETRELKLRQVGALPIGHLLAVLSASPVERHVGGCLATRKARGRMSGNKEGTW
jgi:Zn-dependent M16 (insulinase) family peptidase